MRARERAALPPFTKSELASEGAGGRGTGRGSPFFIACGERARVGEHSWPVSQTSVHLQDKSYASLSFVSLILSLVVVGLTGSGYDCHYPITAQ